MLCSEFNEGFAHLEREANILTGYAVFPRYPVDIELDEEDGKTAIRFAKKINDYVIKLIFQTGGSL
jgi:hypothetical protein